MTAPAEMLVNAELIAELLHLPNGVAVTGADFDLPRNCVRLWLHGTPHPGQRVSPSFTKETVTLLDWGAE